MNSHLNFARVCAASLIAFSALAALRADVIETKNGARIVGEVVKISEGTITMKTDYAGELAIKQGEVTAITTDKEITVRLESGTVLQGTLSTEAGSLKITGGDGQLSTNV
ncbi:MAG TPA: hypothetical protein VEA63_00310, partial [Opitutus sp.]|nr:hypothetical protein [Opitutus sp.]